MFLLAMMQDYTENFISNKTGHQKQTFPGEIQLREWCIDNTIKRQTKA